MADKPPHRALTHPFADRGPRLLAASVKPHQGESGPPGDVVWMAARWCRPPLWWMVLALWACDVAENRTTRGGVGRLVLITTCFVVFYFFTLISPVIP